LAVSNSVTPRSRARWTQATAFSLRVPLENVSQEPKAISETTRSLEPNLRYFIGTLHNVMDRAARRVPGAQF
jgi:hypothetical protein